MESAAEDRDSVQETSYEAQPEAVPPTSGPSSSRWAGLRRRRAGRRSRPRRCSRSATNASLPSGQPVRSWRRTASSRGSSRPEARKVAQSPASPRRGVVAATSRSARRARCAPGTAPGPILRPRHKPGADRIKLDVPGRGQNIVIVERARAEPPLPEMPDPALPLVDGTRVAAVHLAERSTQSVGIRGHKEEMDIVGIRQ